MFHRADERDYYTILQVDPRAEPEVIEAAYRRLSRKYHPDVNGRPDAGLRMRELNEAYDVLSDPDRRAAYDRRRSISPGPRVVNRPAAIQHLLRLFVPYLALAIVAMLTIRLLPLLIRPPILVGLATVVLAYLFLRRLRRQ